MADEITGAEQFTVTELAALARDWAAVATTDQLPRTAALMLSRCAEVLTDLVAASRAEAGEPADHYRALRYHAAAMRGERRRLAREIERLKAGGGS